MWCTMVGYAQGKGLVGSKLMGGPVPWNHIKRQIGVPGYTWLYDRNLGVSKSLWHLSNRKVDLDETLEFDEALFHACVAAVFYSREEISGRGMG